MRFQQKSIQDANIRNAEALFETRRITEIREVEAQTRREIEEKQEELRQLVGHSYRDLIESADSILLMKKSCHFVSQNILSIESGFRSLNTAISDSAQLHPQVQAEKKKMGELYGMGSRVKYLVDTAENIWGCLDEHMFLEASGRYLRAKEVYTLLVEKNAHLLEKSFPLLRHQWQLVENFRGQISQRSKDRLVEQGLGIEAYAVALAAVAVIDEVGPKEVFGLFLETRRAWLRQRVGVAGDSVSGVLCSAARIIQETICQAGELFLQVLNELPLFYRVVLAVPPGSQVFGGIPNPDNEVNVWKSHREKLEATMVMLPPEFIADFCLQWLKSCGEDVFVADKIRGKHLMDLVKSGKQLAEIERLIRETLESSEAFEGGLDWLTKVFGSNIESPWQCVCELVLKQSKSLWYELFEDLFVDRMKQIIGFKFAHLREMVKIGECLEVIMADTGVETGSLKSTVSGGWFVEREGSKSGNLRHRKVGWSSRFMMMNDEDWFDRLNAYLGSAVTQIKDTIDKGSKDILEDLVTFLNAQNSISRINDLAPYLQDQCLNFILTLIVELKEHLACLSEALNQGMRIEEMPKKQNMGTLEPPVVVERALFIGRLLVAIISYSDSIPLILSSSQLWFLENKSAVSGKGSSIIRHSSAELDHFVLDSSGRQLPMRTAGLKSEAVSTNSSFKFNDLRKTFRSLCIRAHNIWILWITEELSAILTRDLLEDNSLSTNTPLKGWEDTVLKQENDCGEQLETIMSLPAMPSLYITTFLFQGCQEIYRIGGHLLDKVISQHFARKLLEKVLNIYETFLSSKEFQSQVSEKGVLQILFDLRFVADVLSGGQDVPVDAIDFGQTNNSFEQYLTLPASSKRKLAKSEASEDSMRKRVSALIQNLSSKLDPIDWATFEPYLWENERQAYQRGAVLFGFLVQFNRMYTDNVQKLPTNSDTNTLKMNAAVPRFTYLPISAPLLSGTSSSSTVHQTLSDDLTTRSSWKSYSNGNLSSKFDFEDTSSFGIATPLLKSIMSQVGSRFGEGTFRLGSMLTDGQVGKLKDKSAAAMSTFGDILPAQAAGLLSSLTVGSGRPE